MPGRDDRPLISVVLLSYDRFDLLRQALRSLERQTYRPIEIILVDNESPSSPAIRSWAARDHPAARLVPNPNTGYAGGMNRGLREASGDYVEFHTDDIVHAPDYFENLMAAVRALPSVGAANGIVYEDPGHSTIRYCGGTVHFGADFYLTIHGLGQPDTGQFTEPFTHGFAAGANLFMPLPLARELGGFDEDYFMYYEDVDLSLRLTSRGHALWAVPLARSHHIGHPVGTMTGAGRAYAVRNLGLLYRKRAGLWKRLGHSLYAAAKGAALARTKTRTAP
jgi:GT2 family glycosyltransferase